MAVDITALRTWLFEKAGPHLADQERQTLESILAKEQVAQVFNEGFAGRSEINRRLDEIREKDALREQEVKGYIQSLNTWRDNEQAKVNANFSEIKATYESQIEALRHQLEGEGLQPTVPVVKTNGAAMPTKQNGNTGSVSQEEVARIVQSELAKAAMLPALVSQITEQHRRMFNDVPDMAKVTDTALRTGRSLNDVWRETYKVGEREQQIQKEAEDKRVADGVAAAIAKMQADGAMNQQNFTGRQSDPSPIRSMIAAQRQAEANSPLAIPQPVMQQSEGVRLAVEALNSGRFEVKRPGQ